MLRPILAALALAALSAPASAFPEFQKQFLLKFTDGADPAFVDLCKEAKCFICHQGKDKHNRNPFGEALHEHVGKKDRKNVEKIVAALEAVAAESTNPDLESAPTFGELIAQGQLPGGTLEDCKKEPEKE